MTQKPTQQEELGIEQVSIIDTYNIKLFITLQKSQWEKEERERTIKTLSDLIVDEILICRKENTPTSRLTSLFMKIKKLIN